jgi:8-oxo-dGTP pyrophosphatase MutT (NUDIX family)
VKKAAFTAFRRLPRPLRRTVVHLAAPSFTVGAVAVLRRSDGCVAFVDQRHSHGWALPGGLLRRRERPDDCVVREVAEETGIQLDVAALPVPLAAVAAGVRRVDVVYIVAVADDIQLRTHDEVEVRQLGWFALDRLPEVTEPTIDILRAVRLV